MDGQGGSTLPITQVMDQLQATMRDFSPIVGTFYAELVAAGVPVDLAESLVLQWHELFLVQEPWLAGRGVRSRCTYMPLRLKLTTHIVFLVLLAGRLAAITYIPVHCRISIESCLPALLCRLASRTLLARWSRP